MTCKRDIAPVRELLRAIYNRTGSTAHRQRIIRAADDTPVMAAKASLAALDENDQLRRERDEARAFAREQREALYKSPADLDLPMPWEDTVHDG